jgi:hypothetical protein
MPHINWPDLTFPPVNLWSLVPAWYFYMSAEEKEELARKAKFVEVDKQ